MEQVLPFPHLDQMTELWEAWQDVRGKKGGLANLQQCQRLGCSSPFILPVYMLVINSFSIFDNAFGDK